MGKNLGLYLRNVRRCVLLVPVKLYFGVHNYIHGHTEWESKGTRDVHMESIYASTTLARALYPSIFSSPAATISLVSGCRF
jgi:hypothetical protein